MMKRKEIILLSILVITLVFTGRATYAERGEQTRLSQAEFMAMQARDFGTAESSAPLAMTPCVNGSAAGYPCSNVDLMAFMPLNTIGGGEGNDIWGWTDGATGKEYAIMGRTSGTSFVDISDPENPVYLGNLPTHTSSSNWRDVKVYADHAFIVSEASGHGMQIFDLTQLETASPNSTFSNTAHYGAFGNAHNVVINEESGYAYAVGTGTCSGGLHMVNIQNPTSPTNAGCFSSDGYTHDAQCVNYAGPDSAYVGRELCFNSNEDTLTIVDVNNKSNPSQLSRVGYSGSQYTHQGWLTEDHRYFLLDDELDEVQNGNNTRTYIWDVSDLDNPIVIGNYTSALPAIDHNLYIKENFAYQANYRAGLRILDLTNVASADLTEVAYFDIYPSNDNANFNGAWSNYPYFDSGIVIVSGIEQGLFVLRPNLGPLPPTPTPGPTSTPAPPTPTPEPGACATYSSGDTPIALPLDTASINSTLNIPNPGSIADVNVSVNMPHAWVGDLIFTLEHAGTAVTIIDQPGVPASNWGCSQDNIVATLDDSAATPIESACSNAIPTINGTFAPNNALSAFNGLEGSGDWVLTVEDTYVNADAGTLSSWAVEICTASTSSTSTPVPPTNTPIPTNTSVPPTSTPLPTDTAVPPTNTPIPTDTAVPPTNTPAPPNNSLYVSSSSSGSVGGVNFADEDILVFDAGSGAWSLYLDGSDVGLSGASGRDVDAFHLLDDGSILLSIVGPSTLPDVGAVDDSDIVRFMPSSLGASTAGSFELYFDGSDVELSSSMEDIDAVTVLDDGSLLISTLGSASVTGISARDEDLLQFVPSSLGETTAGTWSLYFDGSDVGLNNSSNEDVWGVSADSSGNPYITTKSTFATTGIDANINGDGSDVILCDGVLGSATSCAFTLSFDGSANGYGSELMDGLHVGGTTAPASLRSGTAPSDASDASDGEEPFDIEDFNNGDVDDNGETAWITSNEPEPTAVQLDSAGSSQSLPTLLLLTASVALLSLLMVKRSRAR